MSPSKRKFQGSTFPLQLSPLAGDLPSYTIPEDSLKDLPPLQLADPDFYRSSPIDVLIGADILPSIILRGSHSNICGTLLGQETIFGWTLCGPIATSPISRICSFSARLAVTESKPDSILTKFGDVEDVPVKLVKESTSVCEENFIRSTKRSEDGRYVVSLPFKEPDNIKLGHSRPIALAQYFRNEMRLSKILPVKEQCDSVIQKYLDLGHMHQVSPNDSSSFHHAVFKPDSTTTKVRVVFNASNLSSNGNGLNDILHAGPVLHSDLTIQILKWVFLNYMFRADITKMYRQIRLDAVTFGLNCAPFLAIRVLQQLSQDILGQYPLASDIISNSTYIDDLLAGAHTQQSAITAYTKREVLSQIAKLFDPGWDQPLPTDLVTLWQEFVKGYPILREIRSRTWIRVYNGSNDNEQCIQMSSLQGSPRSEGLPTVSPTAGCEAAPRGTH
ncbi:uncharacterized protein [Drosophila kikkawai]|uniref:Peptidase aspartic putative domain-containing protein n=1 Tax=Drosophila kikkawai TaxID=30033 RepID=A0ABM4GPJ1_DROKI